MTPRRIAILALVTLTVPAPARATILSGAVRDTLSGRVTDAAGEPLDHAEIVLVELDRSLRAGADGRFMAVGVPAGIQTVLIRHPGYAPVTRRITVAGRSELSVEMAAAPIELSALTVTATRAPSVATAGVLSTDALEKQTLRSDHGVSLAHTLDDLPGVHNLSTGEQIGKPVIRGVTGSEVRVLGDGLPLEDYSWSDEDAPSVDARLADRVEVVRGPMSVMYGSDAIGGVINVLPAPIFASSEEPVPLRANLELYGASNNGETGGALELAGGTGAFGWRAMGVARRAEDLHTPTGPLENTGFASFAGEAALGLQGDWGSSTLRYTRYGGEFKLLEVGGPPPGLPEGEEEGPERKLSDDRVQFATNLPFGTTSLETKVQYQRHLLTELGDVPDSAGGPPVEGTEFELLLNTVSADVAVHYNLGDHFRGTGGVSGFWQDNDTRGPIPVVPDAQALSGGAFAVGSWYTGPVTVLLAGRFDARSLDADPNATLGTPATERDWHSATADIGIAYEVARGFSLRANLGRAWRAPNLFELFANGPRIGDQRYEIGQPDLATETAVDVDAGVSVDAQPVRASVSAFRNAYTDYIYLSPTADTISGLQVFEYQQADARLVGVEAEAQVDASKLFTFRGRFDYVQGTNQEIDQPLPLIPPASGAVAVDLHPSVSWSEALLFTAETEFFAEQTRLSPYDYATDGYALVNLAASVRWRWAGRQVWTELRVRNLGDVSYKSYLSRYKTFALNPGRNVALRFAIGW
jgi:iron complex outermembrane recepter protein